MVLAAPLSLLKRVKMDKKEGNLTDTGVHLLPQKQNGAYADPIVNKSIVSFCLYARKSTESDERQALSIDSQIKEMAQQAQTLGIRVIEIRKESHSAKATGKRPVFNQLLEDIKQGIFQGILSWAPDRLSRNAGDLGALVDLMDNGFLKEIRTNGQIFTNSPNDKFLLMILCSQAKLENDNRGINVKRGHRAKCEMGFRPNTTPLGYENDHYSGKGQKKVFVDKTRAPIIKKIFEKVAYQKYSGRDIYDWLKDKTKLRSKNGKIINLSSIYRMLNNPYYCGLFEFPQGSNKWYNGSYEPIISRKLFDAVQKKMEVPPKSKPGSHQFDFTKLFKCGACGSGITAQRLIRKYYTGTVKHYIYYHCTQFYDFDCPEPYIREEKIVEQLTLLLKDVPIKEVESRAILKPELDKFMVLKYAVQKNNQTDEETKKEVDLTEFIRYILQDGTKEQKRELISCLNKTIYLKDKELVVKG
jgi:DNA invertase Pin-like site-specific DNA recombinase